MKKHQGQITEYIVRKNGFNISDLARALKINRRSIYNWFNQENLKSEYIFRIGCVIRHDFSNEFPELFASNEFERIESRAFDDRNHEEHEIWKEKYFNLLESYNTMLTKIQNKTASVDAV